MCVAPITIGKGSDSQLVGCGRCHPCFMKYANQWAFRLQIHLLNNYLAYFVTLTYDNQNLPTIKHYDKVYMTLVKSHIQSFIKRLRKNAKTSKKISYLCTGEYGDKFKRPHYHLIIFNATPDDILKSWDKGQIHIGTNVSNASIVYTLKYSMKSKLHKMYHKSAPYQRPFMLCSKGIGSDFLKYKHLPTTLHWNNLKITLPRYYTKKLNITLDDPEMRQRMIDQSFKLLAELDRRKITWNDFRKSYSNYLYKLDKSNFYECSVKIDENILSMLGQSETLPTFSKKSINKKPSKSNLFLNGLSTKNK